MIRCHVHRDADATMTCLACGHAVGSHLYPSGICVECAEVQLARLDMTEELHTRVDRLAFAVQVLTEKLDGAHLERLDVIASAWPQRMRTIYPDNEPWEAQ